MLVVPELDKSNECSAIIERNNEENKLVTSSGFLFKAKLEIMSR